MLSEVIHHFIRRAWPQALLAIKYECSEGNEK